MQNILIAMSDAGGGHRRLSEALAQGFERLPDKRASVRIEDLFKLDPRSWGYRLARLYAPTIRHLPALYGLVYHAADGQWRMRRLTRGLQDRLLPRARELVRDLRPSVVITTHPLVNPLVLDALEAEGLATPVLAQVSEIGSAVHASWVEPRIAAYAAGTEEVRAAILAQGAPAARVRVLGMPMAPGFGRVSQSPRSLRQQVGLDPDRFTVLAIGGGEGAGKLRMVVEALADSGLDLQLVVVCGRNSGIEHALRALPVRVPMRVLGYVSNMPELMHLADVVVTKGGAQTLAETFAAGRPVLVSQTLPGQEQGNDRLVERHGAGFSTPTAAKLVAATARLALDDDFRARVTEAARQLARPDPATAVAEWALQLAEAGRQQAERIEAQAG